MTEEQDDHYADMGFMFEGSEASTLKHYEFKNDKKTIKVALNVVDEDPGAVQSGHYLWPGAPALAQYLLQVSLQPTAVLELGAGCALASIAALQVFDSIQYLVATDHDPGTLEKAENNHDATLEYLGDERFAERLLTVPIRWEPLTWGDDKGTTALLSDLQSCTMPEKKFDLVLGSDLIYDKDVVKPLIVSVSLLMEKGGTFLLSQSFVYDDATEREIDSICSKLGLERTITQDDLKSEGGVKLQNFRWK
jgi:predicted nicotinamide N-methyase